MSKTEKQCCDCIHYSACAAWNVGSIAGMKCDHCVNYERDNSGKCADQMFRELGYLWEGTPNGDGREYEGEVGDTITVTRFGATFKDPGRDAGIRIGRDFILACAQLIKEMEADNE